MKERKSDVTEGVREKEKASLVLNQFPPNFGLFLGQCACKGNILFLSASTNTCRSFRSIINFTCSK